MFKIIRINRKYLILLFLLFLFFNLFTLTFLSHKYLNVEDSDDKFDQITNELLSLKSSSAAIESTTITKGGTSDVVLDMPSYRPEGDLYIAQIAMTGWSNIETIPHGWTEIEDEWKKGGPGSPDVQLATYWKIGNSSEQATYTWIFWSPRKYIGAIHRINGFDLINPINTSGSEVGQNANPTSPSVTTTIDECLILRMFGAIDNTVTDWPNGTTPRFQERLVTTNILLSAAAYHTQTPAGDSGAAQFTMEGTGSEKWVAMTIAINPDKIPPIYSNLTESADPLQLGETETIRINTSDPSGINQVLIEFEGSNHSMANMGGDMWQYEWEPSSIGSKSYTIWMEDNCNNWNSTSGSIMVIDTIAPTYSDLIESADPLPLGQNETISIRVFDSGSGVNQVILEYESSNHTMTNVAETWSWSNWRPSSNDTYTYKIYMEDNLNNWNTTDVFNITVIITTAPIIGIPIESADPLELGNNITITVDVFDDISVSLVLIELESVNYTMNNVTGNTFEYTWTRSTVGIVIYTIHANDTDNSWSKRTSSFNIIDTTSPNYANLTESSNFLELGDTLTVAIDTFDLSGIKQVRIEYEGDNHSMSIIGGNTWQYDLWTPSSAGIHFYTILIEDNNNNWNSTISNITVQDTISPIYSNLIESGDPIELGTELIITITVYDLADIKEVLLEYEGSNHSMANMGGDLWRYDSWTPNRVGNYSYTIYMEDNNNNHNSTNGSIEFQDTISPVYSNLIESADPLELGNVETITIEIDDFSGINKSLIEFEGSNHSMTNIFGNVYQYNTWTPSNSTVYQYKIYMEDNSGNSNVTSGNITVQDTIAPIIGIPIESADPLELGNNITITVDVFDDGSVSLVLIELLSANYTMFNVGGNTFERNWTGSTVGIAIYTIHAKDNENNWNKLSRFFEIEDTTSPNYANLTESSNFLELGDTVTVAIDAFDLSGIKQVSIEYEGDNHSMSIIGGNTWQHLWTPSSTGIHFYTIWIEDNNYKWNFTISNITVQDTISPIYSDLIMSGNPIELGTELIITITVYDLADIKEVLLEYEGSNHSMANMGGDLWQYDSWMPNRVDNYSYTIYMEDNSGNSNVTSGNITVQDTTPPSPPIITNAPSGDVSGVLVFDWLDGSDPSGISYYILIIDNETDPNITPGYIFMSNITNIGPESSYFELSENFTQGTYYYFLSQVDGGEQQSSFSMGSFTVISINNEINNGNNNLIMIIIIISSVIGAIAATTIVLLRRRIQKNIHPRKKTIPLRTIISHINEISSSQLIFEKEESQKKMKRKKPDKTLLLDEKDLEKQLNEYKVLGEELFNEGAYLEAQKQFEDAEKLLLTLGRKEEAIVFSELSIGIMGLIEEHEKRLERLEQAKLEGNSINIFNLYYEIIGISTKFNDLDAVNMYQSELIQLFQDDELKLKDLESQRFNLYKQANSQFNDNLFEKAAENFEKCEKISQFLVQLGREEEIVNVQKFTEKKNECLKKNSY